jgi:hypothetical protein
MKAVTDRIRLHHSIALNAGVERVFPMFTPLGEKAWVAGWSPQFHSPKSGLTTQGMVFQTGEADELTLWACCDWAPERFHVRYVRVTPASRFGFVEVTCIPASHSATVANVTYELTALSPHSEAFLRDFAASFAAMIDTWEMLINQWLGDHPGETVKH